MRKITFQFIIFSLFASFAVSSVGCSFRDLTQALRDNQTTGASEPIRKERGEGAHGKREKPADRAPAGEGR